ncbi:MAG TPA: alpha-amylase family glycosyl hydrolase, partial [Verrucomicrobiae bacterium]|nr:alpha-amylase family glycosyl hydrolase [Verrucomicrobiae bacterium]
MRSRRQRSKYGPASGQRIRREHPEERPRSQRLLGDAGHGGEAISAPAKQRTALPIAKRIPGCTYRLQFNREFTFSRAAGIIDYLRELGVSDLYASPVFKARPGSMHGYDVCGPGEFNPDIGTSDTFDDLSRRLKTVGMGLLLDIVPNHMGRDCSNVWWHDVLQNGPNSRHAKWFDIDWTPPSAATAGRVLLPILEDHYARVLEAGKLRVCEADGKFFLNYHEKRFPLSVQSSRALKQQ